MTCTICEGLKLKEKLKESPDESAARFFTAGVVVAIDSNSDIGRALGTGVFVRVRMEKILCEKHKALVLDMFKEAQEALSLPRPPEGSAS